ncbi:MAG TPA: TIGR02996 domain-containing protein [Caulobacteraceae bacterium]
MADDARMIEAIIAAPDDDAPRRAYAEWLKARGDPRGEFIELQLKAAASPDGWRSEFAARDLRAAHGESWVPAIQGLSVTAFRRGFPESIFISGDDFLDCVDAIFGTMPVREVTLWGSAGTLERIVERPELRRLRALSLSNEVTVEGLAALAASPWVSELASLSVDGVPIGDAGGAALAGGTALRRLSTLMLVNCGIGREGAESLAGSQILGAVTYLNLSANPLAAGTARVVASPYLARIERLYLGKAGVDDAACAAIALASGLSGLTELNLPDNRIRDEGAAALANSVNMPNLVRLRLSENGIGDAGAAAFASAHGLPKLEVLDLSSNAIGEAGAEALANGSGLPALKTLGLSYNPIYVPGATEEWKDWDGSSVGSGPVKVDTAELKVRYGQRFEIT